MSNPPKNPSFNFAELSRDVEIVVSGMSGKFPDSENAKEYYDSLVNKIDLCNENTRTYGINHPNIPKLGGRLKDYESFDVGYFGIHGFEASYMDPMGRLLIEQVIQALFDAGIHPDELKGTRTGVFVGACSSEHEILFRQNIPSNSGMITGSERSMTPNRVSYFLQLDGPSMNCDTACSSSMYALDQAYKSILLGKCDKAIVGGTNLTFDPYVTLQFVRLGVLNDGSGCRPFDNDATGYTRGEAIVAIILQKRTEAKRIYGNIVHVKTNADGSKPQGITFPSFDGQLELINDVFLEANADPKEVGFLEAHGTGTRVGDPEELGVIDAFFKPTKEEPLLIGSVKGNIGHTEPSAALCSIVKTLAALNMGQIAPNIHYDTPKVGVSALEEKRLQVVTELMPFPTNKLYAAVNSFGFGGANGHVIFKKYNKPKSNEWFQSSLLRLVCYSGRTQAALDAIHEQIHASKDLEYLSLLQESFKTNIANHIYRGFTIVGSEVKSASQISHIKQGKVFMILDQFNGLTHVEDLMELPLLKASFEEIKNSFANFDVNMIYKLMILKVVKELSPEIELWEHNESSISFSKYFRGQISFNDLLQKFDMTDNFNCMPKLKDIAEFLAANTKFGNRCTIIIIGDNKSANFNKNCNTVHFDGNMTQENFLSNIGSLYEFGYNQLVHKLYHQVEYPVSSGTSMLSHLLQWNSRKPKDYKIRAHSFVQQEKYEVIWFGNAYDSFIRGHLIDDRNLYPATGYLYHVWSFVAERLGRHPHDVNVLFENVSFHRATTCFDKPIELYFVVYNDGTFEISDKAAVVVTGRILADVGEDVTPFPIDEDQSRNNFVLNSKDVYRDLRLRGYNYKGLFRGIQEAGPNSATIKWNEEWITFLDNMMQVTILKADTRSLLVPVGIERLEIRAKEHMEYIKTKEDKLITVNFCEKTKSIRSNFVEVRGLSARSILKRKGRLQPVLESYQFIPNEWETDLSTSIRINMQLLLENKLTPTFKVVEVLGFDQEPVINEICNAIQDLPLIMPDMTIVTSKDNFEMENIKIEQTMSDQNLLIVCQNPNVELIQKAQEALIPDGFLLCIDLSIPNLNDLKMTYILLTTHILEDQRIVYFFRKNNTIEKKTIFCDVSDMNELNWVKEIQNAMGTNDDIVLYAQNNYQNGALGLTNCLTKEPGNHDKFRCVLILDAHTTFDPNNNNEKYLDQQLKKQMTINVFKNGQWGTYRHLLLSNMELTKSENYYAKALNPGDLSSMTWVQKAMSVPEKELYNVKYSSLNFRDLMLASGKLTPEAVTTDRFLLDCMQGLEFAGYDNRGNRVIGLGTSCIANVVDNIYWCTGIPDSWKMEEAATTPVVYITVLYALLKIANIQKGQSILIHSGTGGIGLAALNVCTYFDCDIFVTVGTQEKRDYLLQNYPNIKPTQIGNSRNTSFKQMVMRETKSRGVDIVLNSLAEEKLLASVNCLANDGIFIEIGKYDLEKNSNLPIDITMKGNKYHAVMVDKLQLDSSNAMKVITELLHDGIQLGYVKPLPMTIFQMDEVDKAFKYMSTGKHIGKVLIKIDHEREHMVMPRFSCDPSRSYIIFGGLGGFGLELADWLVMRGAKNIYLTSRKGVTTGYQKYRIALWKSYGIKVSVLIDDMNDYDICYNLLKTINETAPIDGIFNLAVVLSDALWENQSAETMKSSMIPKAILTQNLDSTTRKLALKLRYFVVFSSVSCGRGNAGQTNYGFSNSVMERICEQRHADGLPALAVQWGAIGDVGILEEMQRENNEIAIGGTLQQKVLNCLEVLDQLILQDQPIVSSMVVAEKFDKGIANTPTEAVLRILSLKDLNGINMNAPLTDLGMDSMLAAEIKQVLERDFNLMLSPNELRNLTFAKLEELQSGNLTSDNADVSEDKIILSMLLPRVLLTKASVGIVSFNEIESSCQSDFIVAFPGIDGDVKSYEEIAIATKTHIKCICYDGINVNQKNWDEIINYVTDALHEDISTKKPFKVLSHSIGCFPAIDFIKKLEEKDISATLIAVDSAPALMYRIHEKIVCNGEEELENTIIVEIISAIVPSENRQNLKEAILKGGDLKERAELAINCCSNTLDETKEQIKSLMFTFMERLGWVVEHKKRENIAKMQSKIILYKPDQYIQDISEDYNLSMICEKVHHIETFEGNHVSILQNKNMHKKLIIDFNT